MNVDVRTSASAAQSAAEPVRSRPPLRWWLEIVYCATFYGLYWLTRNSEGDRLNKTRQAFTNAKRVITTQRWLGINHEETIQEWFLSNKMLLQVMNTYYGTAHFIVTIGAFVWCYKVLPHRYRSIRNGFAFMMGIALIGYFTIPLMPPRLMPASYGFVDTMKIFGGPWNFESGPVSKLSNQYAAMPSMHFGWATWVVVTFWPWARGRRLRTALLVFYPLLTLFCIVVTGNHYFLDAVGGTVVWAIGMKCGERLDAFNARRAAALDS